MGPGYFKWCLKTEGGATGTNWDKINSNMRKNVFTLRIAEHWNGLLIVLEESPSLEIIKICPDTFLWNLQ